MLTEKKVSLIVKFKAAIPAAAEASLDCLITMYSLRNVLGLLYYEDCFI
jgi:hypothetical protein